MEPALNAVLFYQIVIHAPIALIAYLVIENLHLIVLTFVQLALFLCQTANFAIPALNIAQYASVINLLY